MTTKNVFKESKEFWKSKTLWTNVLFVVAGLATWASGEMATGATITLAGIINTALRIYTKHELK